MRYGYKQYCKDFEKIENYEKAKADNFIGWCCHHRLETHNSDGERRLVDIAKKELQALDMYYNRPAEELIFLTRREHMSLHRKGKPMSEESKKKMAEAKKGKPKSAETRKKMRGAQKGKNIWIKGTRWYNNGKINIRAKECPDGFVPGRIKKALSFLTQS